MLVEINKNNLSIFNKSFVDINMVKEELNNNPFARFLAYIINEKIVGYLYYSLIYDRIEINQIEVEKSYQRQGIGTTMMKFLAEKKIDITLEVRKDNIPAIKLYEKMGFKEVAVRQGYYGKVDGLLMIKTNH